MNKKEDPDNFNLFLPNREDRLYLAMEGFALQGERLTAQYEATKPFLRKLEIEMECLQFAFDVEFSEIEERFWESYLERS